MNLPPKLVEKRSCDVLFTRIRFLLLQGTYGNVVLQVHSLFSLYFEAESSFEIVSSPKQTISKSVASGEAGGGILIWRRPQPFILFLSRFSSNVLSGLLSIQYVSSVPDVQYRYTA